MLKKAFKTELDLTSEQKRKVNQTMGVCRFLYNLFIITNQERHEKGLKFMSGYSFSKYVNNEFLPNNLSYSWIKQVSSKATKRSIMNAETAYKRFFKGLADFPKYKKRHKDNIGIYLPKNNITDFKVERHRIKIPCFSWVKLKEYGYIPRDTRITSCTVTRKAGKYYISVLCEVEENTSRIIKEEKKDYGIGIDLGIKDLAICSNNKVFKNINKTEVIKKLEKKLKREQRSFSRKLLATKSKRKNKETCSNLTKKNLIIKRIYDNLFRTRTEYIRACVNSLVKENPQFVTIEDLNIRGMMKNRHLSKAIAQQKLYYFRMFLIQQCKKHDIEVRVVNRFYPSSKLCSKCGSKKKDLKLSDRTYICNDCGLEIDRDINASINLRECQSYVVA